MAVGRAGRGRGERLSVYSSGECCLLCCLGPASALALFRKTLRGKDVGAVLWLEGGWFGAERRKMWPKGFQRGQARGHGWRGRVAAWESLAKPGGVRVLSLGLGRCRGGVQLFSPPLFTTSSQIPGLWRVLSPRHHSAPASFALSFAAGQETLQERMPELHIPQHLRA